MRVITNDLDTAICFDSAVWKQERNLIYFSHDLGAVNPSWVDLYAQPSAGAAFVKLARYTLDAQKRVTIDVSDYIRAYPSVTAFRTLCEKESEELTIPLQVVGLINPANVIIPECASVTEFGRQMVAGFPFIGLPTRILRSPFTESGEDIRVEFYPTDEMLENATYWTADDRTIERTMSAEELGLGTDGEVKTYEDNAGEVVQDIRFAGLLCGTRYALVRWVSFTGATRVHTFEVRGVKSGVADAFSLETIDNSYNTTKGREDGFTLHLDSLTTYDLWYYGDLVMSSRVEVSLDGQTWSQVDVLSKGVEIPDGDDGEFNELDVQVNWRRYDAVSL